MSTQVITGTLQREAQDLINHEGPLEFQVLDRGQVLRLGRETEALLMSVLTSVAEGSALRIERLPEELTSVQAAELLGVSRPTLIKWIKEGKVNAHFVGTHRRLKIADVLHFKAELHAKRSRSFDELRAVEDELGIAESPHLRGP